MNEMPAMNLTARVGRIAQRIGLAAFSGGETGLGWRTAAGVAIDLAGEEKSGAIVPDDAAWEFQSYIDRATPAIAEFTGLELKGRLPAPVVFNRNEWIAQTARNLMPVIGLLLEGAIKSISGDEERDSHPSWALRAAVAAEAGLVFGYLAKRVLGQYDLPIIDDDRPAGLYFIYPNIVDAERRLGIRPRSFRQWLALHEATHGFEFEANPWIKNYLRDLIVEQTDYLNAKLRRAGGKNTGDGARAAARRLFAKPIRDLVSPATNPVLAKMQALMAVLEGYSEYVMEMSGADLLDGESGIAELLSTARKNRTWPHKLIERLMGLEMKIEQYHLGYMFVKKAVQAGGMGLVNSVWAGPDKMPTLTELNSPELWVARMLKTG